MKDLSSNKDWNLMRDGLCMRAGSSLPMLLREGNRVRSILVSEKLRSEWKSERENEGGKLMMSS